MNTEKDRFENYYQTVQKYKDSINVQTLEQGIDSVIEFVRNYDSVPIGQLNLHDKSKIFKDEIYKYDIFDKAHEALSLETWSADAIGSGKICKCVIEAMAHTDNLVNRRFAVPGFLDLLKTTDIQKQKLYDHTLYEIYLGDDEEKAFSDAISCFKGKYSLLAFLFFIKDHERFLPTSPETFDAIFNEIGIPFKMSKRCSWNNYCEFIAIISCVKVFFVDLSDYKASLQVFYEMVYSREYSPI